MSQRKLILGLVGAVAASSIMASGAHAADRPWQSLQMPTAAQVLAQWKTPPSEYGSEPYYALAETMDKARSDLDKHKAMGFRAVAVQFAGGTSFQYLSPEYFAYFKAFVAEAKKRDMRLWIVDDAGYPSGFSGGKFTTDRQDLRMQTLTAAQRWPVAGGEALDQAAPEGTVAATAVNAETGATVQVPIAQGRVRWTAPAGRWTVIAVAHGFDTSPVRSDLNPARVKDKSNSLLDYLDPAATAQYIAFTHDAYKRAVGDEFGKTILGFRGDEPDFSVAGLPWTPRFFERFTAVKGYDIRPYLASFLGGREARLTPEQALAKADYYDVFSLLFEDGFFKPLGDWVTANGLEYQIHLNHEERLLELAKSEGDFFRTQRHMPVPAVDSIWHQIFPDTVADFPRLASSVAHIYGRPHAMTESFAAYRPAADITVARYAVNQQMVRGINQFEMMFYSGQRGSGSAYMTDPGFPALTTYTQRLSYLMSMGRPAAQVAVLAPRGALYMDDRAADAQFVSTERLLSEHQIDFDVVDEDAVGSVLKAGKGVFETASGNNYRTVIVPQPDLLPAKVVDRLRAFAQGGGKVLFLGRLPTRIADASYRTAREARPDEFSWATLQTGTLAVTPTPPANPVEQAPGPQNAPPEIVAAVKAAVGVDDLALATPALGVRYIHRQLKDASVFLLFNESGEAVSNEVTLRAAGKRVEAWDPQTGAAAATAGVVVAGSAVRLPVALGAYETKVLIVR